MNIFILDNDPYLNSIYHNNFHVGKMILEHTQMACTVLSIIDNVKAPYKRTHINHPCTQWLMKSRGNWEYLKVLTRHLNEEFKYRSKHKKPKDHKSYLVMMGLETPSYKDIGLTPFAQAIKPEFRLKNVDAVTAYRHYYNYGKRHLAIWGKRGQPEWYLTMQNV